MTTRRHISAADGPLPYAPPLARTIPCPTKAQLRAAVQKFSHEKRWGLEEIEARMQLLALIDTLPIGTGDEMTVQRQPQVIQGVRMYTRPAVSIRLRRPIRRFARSWSMWGGGQPPCRHYVFGPVEVMVFAVRDPYENVRESIEEGTET
jgi:hypothetical protein